MMTMMTTMIVFFLRMMIDSEKNIPSTTEHRKDQLRKKRTSPAINIRRENRIKTIQFLYMWSLNPSDKLSESLYLFLGNQQLPRSYYAFSAELAQGAIENHKAIDDKIKLYLENWDFLRIAKIDLAILRLAIYELLFRHDIPPIVSINEAIDLSKIFSIEDAKRFINGILDRCKADLKRPSREAKKLTIE